MVRTAIGFWVWMVLAFSAAPVEAGIPECGGIRLEDAGRCRIKGSIECTGGCTELGIYKKACATRLHTVCRDTCTLSPMPTCTDECTETCQERCDAGEDITCIHNCFGECSGSCTTSCEGADDLDQCLASCEATCDGECDIKCAPLVSGSCYEHCIECCGGSCGAQANMDCQTSCQDEEFETCEHELRVDCDASCAGDGALFCDGEFVLAGNRIDACVRALLDRGVEAEAKAAIDVGNRILDEASDRVDATTGGTSCQLGRGAPGTALPWVLACLLLRKRRRTREPSR